MMNSLAILLVTISVSVASQCVSEIPSGPFSTLPPTYLPRNHSLVPTATWGSYRAPYPTNSFFTNLALEDGRGFPVHPFPYSVILHSNGIEISYSGKISTNSFVMSTFLPNIYLESSEEFQPPVIDHFDQMSISMKWNPLADGAWMSCPIVRGSPYMTLKYSNATPQLRSIHAILNVNGNWNPSQYTGTQFTLQLNNGQIWKLYSLNGNQITLNWIRGYGLKSASKFTGTLRIAIVTQPQVVSPLDNSVETVPIASSISYCPSSTNEAAITMTWITEGGNPANLLMLALPHHMDSIDLQSNVSMVMRDSHGSIKGKMTGIMGQTWVLKETLTTIKWFSPHAMDEDKISSIRNALNAEKGWRANVFDPYGQGKSLAAMGRLALIADELGDAGTAQTIRENLKRDIEPWLTGTNSNPLRYETRWGGICSSFGMSDPNADYGQGWYNDHHFHYGYFLYAAAALGKEDRAWLNSRKDQIMDLVRDIANPSNEDQFFPVTRHKDWYDGHSWASGLFPFGDAKNQESTSESMNAYYALYLLGESFGNAQMSFFGRLLLATEMRSVKKYWHIPSESNVYDEPFKSNKIAGVLWSSKVDYATFFGGNVEFIHCIQMMPFTPITEEYLPASWISEEYPVVETALSRQSEPLGENWKGFIYMDHAIINKAVAWNEVQTLKWFDGGNSKTNTFYWVATRSDTAT